MQLEDHLKHWFGYNTFRPHQKEVVETILQKRDVVAILPTGAGKSLCYQLPALMLPGTSVVISPLIALMQDQVEALSKSDIPAAYINSSLPWQKTLEIFQNLNAYKLLYVAPERLNDPSFVERLKRVPLSFFVIDEAHCISQWGHSFRPDYRQLAMLKREFSEAPIMALTATATGEVQNDIISQLTMEKPHLIKGSFDRPNLMIRMASKENAEQQVLQFLQKHPKKAGIIYAATRKNVDHLHNTLQTQGYSIGKYHAGMSDLERKEALLNFIQDKIPLMVATVAFGMGINKPNVRFIVHYDMPQSVEQYYQEIGRAGRDGLPAECLMLYSYRDFHVYRYFAKQMSDPNLQQHAENKVLAIYRLCNSMHCRRSSLLKYFDENYHSLQCVSCDRCQQYPTPGAKNAVEKERHTPELLTILKELRLQIALAINIAPHAIFTDHSLHEMATYFPTNERAFLSINGVVPFKLQAYGKRFMNAINDFCSSRQCKSQEKMAIGTPPLSSSVEETMALFLKKMNLAQIALTCKISVATVVEHLVLAMQNKRLVAPIDLTHVLSLERRRNIETVIHQVGGERLKPFKERLPMDYTYEEIRLVFAAAKS